MRTQKRRRAFTLVELIIGMVMMVIVMGGIITGLSMGLRLYGRAEANGKVTNGARFTAASFKHKIWPMMSRASIVEILPNLPDTAVSDSEDCYVYLDESEQCVKYRIGGRDEPLAGSEFITSLDFSVPAASEDRAENFILRMSVEARAPRIKSAHVTLDIDSALINRPAKRGPAREAAYGGPVLHFNIFDFRELNQYTPPGDSRPLKNDETVKKNSVIQLRYDITVPSGRRDATKILYYASTESKASLPKSAGYWEDTHYDTPQYTKDTKDNYCWPLLITSGDEYYLAGDQYKKASGKEDEFLKIPTSGEFYVYTGSNFEGNGSDFEDDGKLKKDKVKTKAERFGRFAILRAWVVPAYSDADGSGFVRPKGYEQWSTRVKIQPSLMPGENFWIETLNAKVNPETDPYSDQFWRPDDETTAKGKMDTEEGTYEVEVTMSSAAAHKLSQTALLAKAVKPEHLKDARRYDAASQAGGVSYTGITNYSYIVDATMKDNVGGLAVILNGYRDENNNEGVNGFMFAYDPGACGIKMFLMNPSGNVGTPSLSNFDYWGSEEQHRPGNKSGNTYYTYWKSGDKNNGIYRIRTQHRLEALMNPGALNQKYSGISNTEASTGNNGNIKNFMYNGNGKTRRRFIVTLLEYYTDKKEYPRLLVRVRLLKNISDVKSETGKSEEQLREEDPFLIGPKFYLSEPAWYRSFVGQKPIRSANNKTFSFRSLFYGDGSGDNSFSFDRLNDRTVYDLTENGMQQSQCTYKSEPVYYAVKNTSATVTNNSTNKLYSNFGGVFRHAVLDAREALESDKYSYKIGNGRKSRSTDQYKLGSTKPNRMRWFGLSVWPDDWNRNVRLTVHDITLGPGFSKDELLAIVENGAKLFGMDETCNKNFSLANCEYEAGRDGGSAWTKRVFGNAGGQSDAARSGSSYKDRFKDAKDQKQTCVMSLQHTNPCFSSGNKDGCPICDAYNKYNSDPTKRISDWGY